MANAENKWWSFFKGVGGIVTGVATAVLAALLVRHFTQTPPPPPINPQANQLGVSGVIRDASTAKNVPGAHVMVGLGPNVASQITDSEGEFAFVLSGAEPSGNQITITVLANGYQEWSGDYNLPAGPRFADVRIIPVQAGASPAAPAGVAPAQIAPGAQLATQAPAGFRNRPATTLQLRHKD